MNHRTLVLLLAVLTVSTWGCGHGHDSTVVTTTGSGGTGNPGGTVGLTPAVFTTFMAATNVLGQADFTGQMPDQGGAAGAATLDTPFGRVAEGSLWIPDQSNNRILGYNTTPLGNGVAADFVLGQPDFATTAPGTSSTNLAAPVDLWRQVERVAVADRLNNRVLLWSTLPLTTAAPADVVIGQPNFAANAPATTQAGMNAPGSVCLGGNSLFVADFNNNRVLIWNTVPVANGTPADVVVGQADFLSNGTGTSATTLNGPNCVWSEGVRLIVCDSNNNRILVWNTIPVANGQPADLVIGQADFNSAVAAAGSTGLSSPASFFATSGQLIVADRGNNRVLDYTPFPTTNQPAATAVLGQSTFGNTAANDDDQNGVPDAAPSARTLNTPTGVMLRGRLLFVTDQGNHRLMLFDGL